MQIDTRQIFLYSRYGPSVVPADGPIPAHIMGNMWAQSWNNIASILRPYPDKPDVDVTQAMQDKGWTPKIMFQKADQFFQSMGLEPMTDVSNFAHKVKKTFVKITFLKRFSGRRALSSGPPTEGTSFATPLHGTFMPRSENILSTDSEQTFTVSPSSVTFASSNAPPSPRMTSPPSTTRWDTRNTR